MLNTANLNIIEIQGADDWNATLQKSLESDKPIFAFFWAGWCEYCKAMARETLDAPEVAAFLNENFLCYSLNTDLEELSVLADTMEIAELPTSVLIAPDIKLMNYLRGYADVAGFMDRTEEILTRISLFKGLREANAELDSAFDSMMDYIDGLDGEWADEDERVNDFFMGLSREGFLDLQTLSLLQQLAISVESPIFGRILENLDDLVLYHSEQLIVDFLYKLLMDTSELASQMDDEGLLDRGLEAIAPIFKEQFPETAREMDLVPELLELNVRLNFFVERTDWEAVHRLADSWLATDDPVQLEKIARNLCSQTLGLEAPEFFPLAKQWSKIALELNPDFHNELIYGVVRTYDGDVPELTAYFEKMRDKYADVEYYRETIEQLLDSMKNF